MAVILVAVEIRVAKEDEESAVPYNLPHFHQRGFGIKFQRRVDCLVLDGEPEAMQNLYAPFCGVGIK